MSGRLQHDEAFKWVASGVLLVWALSAHYPVVGLVAIAVAALDIQVMVLWAAFVGSLFGAIITIITGLAVLLPLQYFPAKKINDTRTNKMRVVAVGCIWVRWCEIVLSRLPPPRLCIARSLAVALPPSPWTPSEGVSHGMAVVVGSSQARVQATAWVICTV
jgi:hypothetical protein